MKKTKKYELKEIWEDTDEDNSEKACLPHLIFDSGQEHLKWLQHTALEI